MRFNFTPDEAQPVALAVVKYFRGLKMSVETESSAWPDAPYRTTVLARRSEFSILVEAQGSPSYHNAMRDMARWLAARRKNAEIYLATSWDALIPGNVLADIRQDGVGWLIVDETGAVTQSARARNAALTVTPDPGLRYGRCKGEVACALEKFNEVDRKDGLRDMCEIAERETEELAIRAVRKKMLVMSEDDIRKKDWASQIDTLASRNAYNVGFQPVIDDPLKTDLHSFRTARNLIDHPAKGKREIVKRQRQFADRMMMGPRLVSELVRLRRRLR